MSPLRRLLALIGLILLIASLVVLAASLWPADRNSDTRQPLSPEDLALPVSQLAPILPFLIVAGNTRRRGWRVGCGLGLMVIAILLCAAVRLLNTMIIGSPPSVGDPPPTHTFPPPTAPPISTEIPAPRPPESRAIELDYPLSLRLGDSDVIRLALVIAPDGVYLTPTAEGDDHTSTGDPVQIPNLYDTHNLSAVARLDSVGLAIDRPGDWEQPLLPGENVIWRWTISATETGRQKANLIIHVRFVPKAGGDVLQKELWARTPTIQTVDVFGLPAAVAKGLGLVGSILGSILSFPFAEKFYSWLWGKIRRGPK